MSENEYNDDDGGVKASEPAKPKRFECYPTNDDYIPHHVAKYVVLVDLSAEGEDEFFIRAHTKPGQRMISFGARNDRITEDKNV